MARNTLPLAELDVKLDRLAAKPDQFAARAKRLARELDRKDLDLEIRDPQAWRKVPSAPQPARISFLNQFRHDVENMMIMDRTEEAKHARRIEFARMRLEIACKTAGIEVVPGLGSEAIQDPAKACLGLEGGGLNRSVLRRQMELHTLRTELVERNLYLVLINVERYTHTGASRIDLIQEGSLSLFRAVDGFDWRRGLLFRTYAVHWLNQAFRNHLYNFGSTVRLPVYLQKAMKHVNEARARLGEGEATIERIAEKAALSESVVQAALSANRSSYSLDASFSSDGDGGRLRDLIASHDEHPDGYDPAIEGRTLQQGIDAAMSKLTEREREVLELRFGIGADSESTLADVANRMGVSVERIRQIQMRAMSKLNSPKLRREFEPWLN
jgi:RNA polymerase primary sigma factor